VDRHGLRGVLHSAGGAEPAVGAQRIIALPMAARAAADARLVPTQHLIEKAHAAAMRNMTLDPGAIESRG
jgi:hypothetical protein